MTKIDSLDLCSLKAHGRVFRCTNCGKFISYKEIDSDLVTTDYTPDTDVTVEETTFTHIKCK